jgi:hypothetical protein
LLIQALVWTSKAYADGDPVILSWQCGMSGFYELDVTPNGNVNPTTDYSQRTSIKIVVRDAGAYKRKVCGWDEHSRHLYIELSGNDIVELYNRDYCSQIMKVFRQSRQVGGQSTWLLKSITGVFLGPMSVVVAKDDADWRYIMSFTDLTTSRESREMRILHPKFKLFDPKASTSFVTGECILETDNSGR